MKKLFLLFSFISYLLADAHIFVYHRFGDIKHLSTNTNPKVFENQIKYLLNKNYKIVTVSKLVKMIKNKENIDRIVCITIDDSYKSFYENGFPILKKYKVPFNLYVYVEAVNRHFGDYSSWKQIKEMSKFGEIGLHSYAHPHLVQLSNEKVKQDTQKAIKIFKEKLGFYAKGYAYPYGEYNQTIKNIIKSFGFNYILNQNIGSITINDDIYDLDRIAMTGKNNIKQKLKIKKLHLKNLEIIVQNNIIKSIYAETNLKAINIYISKYGWKRILIKNNKLIYQPNLPLKSYRTRIIFKYSNKLLSKLFIKQ